MYIWLFAVWQDLQKKDDLYIKDLKKQADDIDLMIERMEEQIKSLSTSYKTEIEEIEVGWVWENWNSLTL